MRNLADSKIKMKIFSSRLFQFSAVLIAAMPPGINTYIFASMYNKAQQTAATSIVICTGLSIFTITAWLTFLG